MHSVLRSTSVLHGKKASICLSWESLLSSQVRLIGMTKLYTVVCVVVETLQMVKATILYVMDVDTPIHRSYYLILHICT